MPAIDLFRRLADLEESSPLLEKQERVLAELLGVKQAQAAISDALLLSFAIKRQRSPLAFNPVGSRQGSVEEFCLLVLIGSAGISAEPLFVRAAAVLRIEPTETLRRLSGDLSKSLAPLFLEGDFIDSDRFEAVINSGPHGIHEIDPDDSSMKFCF